MPYTREVFEFQSGRRFQIFETDKAQKELHCHDCLELNLAKKGRGTYIIGGKLYPVAPGDIFVINDSERHLAVHGEQGLTLTVLIFASDSFWTDRHGRDYLKPFFSRAAGFSNRIGSDARDYEAMYRAFTAIEKEQREKRIGWEMVAEAAAHTLLSLLYRYYNEKQEIGSAEETPSRLRHLEKALTYIDAHFAEEITLERLAQEACISRNYLCSCFQKMTGQTPFSYLDQTRIQYAAYLLGTTRMPIAQVAMEAGFGSVSYFNRRFRRQYHMTPGQFRKQKVV